MNWARQRLLTLWSPLGLFLLALGAGLYLRLLGVGFCYPMLHCHPDEHYLVQPALNMMRTGDFNPHLFVYPTLFIYILLAVFCLTFLYGISAGLWGNVGGAVGKPAPFHVAGRVATAALGTASIAAVYVAGKRLVDRESGAVAAVVLALMPLHVAASHFVTTDVPAGFFCVAALCAAAAVANEGGRKAYIVAGLLCGFAAAAKYNAFLVAVNVPLAHWINPRRQRFFDRNLLRGLAWIALGFLIACPYALLDLPRFMDGVANEISHYRHGHIGHQGELNRLFYLLFLTGRGFGPILTALGVFGVITMIRRFRRRYLLLLAFPALYMLFVGAYKVRFVRNLMPVLPYFALWIGVGAVAALREIRETWPRLARVRSWKLALPALALALALPGGVAFTETARLSEKDTRLQAHEWIEHNLPRGTTLLLQSWSVDSLTFGKYRISRDSFAWDYYVGTDRLTRKYFNMQTWKPIKYREVKEAFQHRPVAVFEGCRENPFYYTANPTVFIFERDPRRPRVRPLR
jgi:4-amino-4-deoxy-L-arabinose transferase-like glycosyltransferase